MPLLLSIIILLIFIIIIYLIIFYNSVISLRNQVKNNWSQIDVSLQRRFDLIPNLVETVKGYISHEESILTKIADLRSSWSNANSISEKAKLEQEFTSSLNSILAIAENYPDLKSNTNFLSLQEELSNTENIISDSRQSYNEIVSTYNTKLEQFPGNILSNLFGFKKEDLFLVDNENIRNNIKISF